MLDARTHMKNHGATSQKSLGELKAMLIEEEAKSRSDAQALAKVTQIKQ